MQTNYSGGEVRTGTAAWNYDPLPKPPPPKVYTYQLHIINGKYEATATATSMEALIDFEIQMRELGYEFIKLERLEEGIPE